MGGYLINFCREKYGIQARIAEFGYNLHDALERHGWVSDLPCNVRRERGQSLVIGGSSLVILEGKECNPL